MSVHFGDMRQRRSGYGPSLLLFFVVQLALLSYAFPVGELLTLKPLTTIDNAFHLYQIELAVDLWQDQRIFGFDPRFSAGYLGGLPYNASAKLPALAASLFSPTLEPVQIQKIWVFFFALLAPACVPLAVAILGLRRQVALISGVFGLLLWWVSAFHWYHTAGMVSYVFGCFATLPFCALLLKIASDATTRLFRLGVGLLGAFLFFFHPLFPFPVLLFAVVVLVYCRRAFPPTRTISRWSIVAVVSLLPNLMWLVPMVHLPGMVSGGGGGISYQNIFSPETILMELAGLYRYPAMGAKIYPLLATLTLYAVAKGSPSVRSVARLFAILWVLLTFFAALGPAIPGIAPLQPNRFAVMGYLFLAIPAGIGLDVLLGMAIGTGRERLLKYGGIALVAMIGMASAWELTREISYEDVGRYGSPPPEVRGLGPTNQGLLEWLAKDTTKDHRVLFETSLAREHDRAHSAGLLARESDREFIGGPYPGLFFAGFWDKNVFGNQIKDIPFARFLEYVDLYNIGWIAAHSRESKGYFSQLPGLVRGPTIGPVETFKVLRPSGFFAEGEGEILERSTNRLVVRSAGDGQALTLKYHYIPGMTSSDGSPVEPVALLDDPVPFIRLRPRDRVVEIRYR